jgi:PPP family 3-phenylpropionic acid transporter
LQLAVHGEQSPRVNALRLYYFASYAGLGAVMPLLALAMQARGLRPSQYAWLMALIPLSRLFAPPLWGMLADRWFGTVKLLRVNTAIAASAMLTLAFSERMLPTALAFSIWAFTSSSLTPLADAGAYRLLSALSLSTRAQRTATSGFAYVRVFGSIGFAGSAFSLAMVGLDRALRVPFIIAACTYVCASLAAGRLYEGPPPTRAPLLPAVRLLARRKDALLLWLGSAFYYLGHGAFDAYFGPYARTLPGVRSETVSMGWAIGVTSEVVVLWFVPRLLVGRLRRGVLIGTAAIAALRWWLIAEATTPLALWLQQPLHAITFGVWYLAFIHENQARTDDSIRATVQGVAVASMGLGMISATLFGGYVFEALGGRVLFRLASGAALLALACYLLRQRLIGRAERRASLQSAAPRVSTPPARTGRVPHDNALASSGREP